MWLLIRSSQVGGCPAELFCLRIQRHALFKNPTWSIIGAPTVDWGSTLYSLERISFMFWKRSLDSLAKFLLTAIILCAGTCAVMGQDSTPAAGADSKALWKDTATGLTWTVKDNGSAVSSNQASDYCSSLRSGGYSDWRLPTIDELETIYDSKLSKQNKVKGPIELSVSCVLSGTTNSSGDVWSFCFSYGGRSLGGGTGCGSSGHALCVQGPSK
jgi:hypothetical protein